MENNAPYKRGMYCYLTAKTVDITVFFEKYPTIYTNLYEFTNTLF